MSRHRACGVACRDQSERYLSMRAEVESPFRTVRIFLLAFFAVSCGIATAVATSQLVGVLDDAPGAQGRTLTDALTTLGIDIGPHRPFMLVPPLRCKTPAQSHDMTRTACWCPVLHTQSRAAPADGHREASEVARARRQPRRDPATPAPRQRGPRQADGAHRP